MKRNLLIAGLICLGTTFAAAQEKDRGDTDYTNNRTKGQPKKGNQVNRKSLVKIIEYIPGSWKIEHVYKGKEDVMETDTLAQSQTIEFNREGRYVSHTGAEKIDSGAYRINEDHAILYLASETNEKPVEWYVSFNDEGQMTLQMKDTDKHSESFRYVYRRNGLPTSSNR
jgi:hypothetical protein